MDSEDNKWLRRNAWMVFAGAYMQAIGEHVGDMTSLALISGQAADEMLKEFDKRFPDSTGRVLRLVDEDDERP